MENLSVFVAGSLIFITYMFILLRMIYKQHKIQEKSDIRIIHISKKELNDNKIAS